MTSRGGPARPAWLLVCLLAAAACGTAAPTQPAPVPGPEPPRPDRPALRVPEPSTPPRDAALLGFMPLASTNVPAFRTAYPRYDGRGVLIAILDGGVDPVAGLTRLPGGGPKLVDSRDVSGEGRVALAPARLVGDSVVGPGVRLHGAARLRGLGTAQVFTGVLLETPLGKLPAADLDGNGAVGDTLPVVVVREPGGWSVLADTDGDGSLANERPVRDYATARETFAWRRGPLGTAAIAVNLEPQGEGTPPVLDLVFDTSAHGTHVAGIAAGHGMYGVEGFDGVAPGAELLSVKIANNAHGGITRTGSMLAGIDRALRFAARRGQPLVINISYGVGNEAEGRAEIDRLVDSVLAAHPGVVMTISAGNDGPGLSTLGLPGTAERPISVGATYPGAFLPRGPGGRRFDDMVAFFSARGGEVARPDLLAPGVAYSTVPAWDIGEEVKNGTSMAAPHAAGLAALLLSGLAAEGRPADAAAIKRALMASGRPLAGGTVVDQGAGLPDVLRAWQLLGTPVVAGTAVARGPGGTSGALLAGLDRDTTLRVAFGGGAEGLRLRPDVTWLAAPTRIDGAGAAEVTVRATAAATPGVQVGVLEAWGADSALGPALRFPVTVVRPYPLVAESLPARAAPGEWARLPIRADSGRAFTVRVSEPRGAPLLAFLHEPGGMPFREGAAQVVTDPDSAAVFAVDGRDAVAGVWELVVMAGPVAAVAARVDLAPAPARLEVARAGDSVRVTAAGVPADSLDLLLIGAERGAVVASQGSAERTLSFTLPPWARRVVVETRLEPSLWSRFTDFGVSLLDASGRLLGTSPLNYAVGRLEVDLPEGTEPGSATVLLIPGFAAPEARDRWHAELAIRLYADSSAAVPLARLGASADASVFRLGAIPWPLGDAFHPLGRAVLRAGPERWARESRLAPPLPALMP